MHSDVRRFVPAEFEGPPARRPRNDPLDRGKSAALERLRQWTRSPRYRMKFTIFSCGVLFERFARGGLASVGIGGSTGANYQGAYLMDIEHSTAEIIERTTAGRPVYVSLISANDVGRFVAAAITEIDLETWPSEFRMAAERLSITQTLQYAESIKGGLYMHLNPRND